MYIDSISPLLNEFPNNFLLFISSIIDEYIILVSDGSPSTARFLNKSFNKSIS